MIHLSFMPQINIFSILIGWVCSLNWEVLLLKEKEKLAISCVVSFTHCHCPLLPLWIIFFVLDDTKISQFLFYFCLFLVSLHIYSALPSHKVLGSSRLGASTPLFFFCLHGQSHSYPWLQVSHNCTWFILDCCSDLFNELPT